MVEVNNDQRAAPISIYQIVCDIIGGVMVPVSVQYRITEIRYLSENFLVTCLNTSLKFAIEEKNLAYLNSIYYIIDCDAFRVCALHLTFLDTHQEALLRFKYVKDES